MDPLSHVVIGCGLASLLKPTPDVRARGLAAALGALSPDIDVALMPIAWDRYIVAHEVGTHSAIGAALCGVAAAGVTRLVQRQARFAALLAIAVAGAMSHILADLLAGATIRVAWPLADVRATNLGVVAMADPFLLGLCVVGGWSMWRAGPLRRKSGAAAFFVVLAAGLAIKGAVRYRADAVYDTHQNTTPADDTVTEPVWASLTDWNVFDRTAGSVRRWRVDAVDSRASIDLTIPFADHAAANNILVARSRAWETVRNFTATHQFAFARIVAGPSDTTRVLWSDIRYCQTATACGIWAGGAVTRSGEVQLFVLIGDWLQARR